jgi:hypothetical protein
MIKPISLAMFAASTTAMHCRFAVLSMLPSAQQKIPDTLEMRNFQLFSAPLAKANATALQRSS